MSALSTAQARRVALAAQGFLDREHQAPTMRTLDRTVQRTGVIQIDSVNVLARAHYLPLYSRMGAYDVDLLHRASGRHPRHLVEYWAHAAAFMPVGLWPLMRWRMRHYEASGHEWIGVPHDPALTELVLDRLREDGPSTARALDSGLPRTRSHWGWNWSETKKALEYLFAAGQVAVAGRTSQFERIYDVPERVLPRAVLDAPEPSVDDAKRELIQLAARSHGVAIVRDLADYHRLDARSAERAVRDLVDAGTLIPVTVEGWNRPAYLHADARVPRRAETRSLLSPFDPLVWERDRAHRLFDFHYRIGIYTPPDARTHGYYALPFLLGDRVVARVDLKADRAESILRVRGAWAEEHAPPDTANQLAAELHRMAGWLRLQDITVDSVGDLAATLAVEVHRT